MITYQMSIAGPNIQTIAVTATGGTEELARERCQSRMDDALREYCEDFIPDFKKEHFMTTQHKFYSPVVARTNGYIPITDDYDLSREEPLFRKALAQLDNVEYCLVSDTNLDTISIWRKKREVDTIKTR